MTEWSVQPNLAKPTTNRQVPEQVAGMLHTNNTLVIEIIKKIGNESVSISQLMKLLELKYRPIFLEYHLNPDIKEGYVRMLYQDFPRHSKAEIPAYGERIGTV